MNRKLLLAVAVLLLFAGFAARKRWSLARHMARLEAVDAETFQVRTEKAAVRDIEERIVMTGTIKAFEEAVLFPRVAGKLRKNLVFEGGAVKRDEAVAIVERDEPGVVFTPAPVPSTIDGVVGRTYLDPGASVTPATPIALVVNQSQVRVRVDLPERYIGKVSVGQAARLEVDAYKGRRFGGRIYKISPVVDPGSRSVPVEVLAPNADARLKSGMFAQVQLVIGRRPGALSVSADALQAGDASSPEVFLARDGRAAARTVGVGLRTPEFVEILSGVKAGEDVINFGLYGLKDGSKIQVIR